MNVFTIVVIVITSALMVYSLGAFIYGLVKKAKIKKRIKRDGKLND